MIQYCIKYGILSKVDRTLTIAKQYRMLLLKTKLIHKLLHLYWLLLQMSWWTLLLFKVATHFCSRLLCYSSTCKCDQHIKVPKGIWNSSHFFFLHIWRRALLDAELKSSKKSGLTTLDLWSTFSMYFSRDMCSILAFLKWSQVLSNEGLAQQLLNMSSIEAFLPTIDMSYT